MKVHVNGTVAGRPVDATFAPVASFQLQPLELIPGRGRAARRGRYRIEQRPRRETGLAPSAQGKVTTVASVPNAFSLAGHTLSYSAIARLALVGFLLTGACRFSSPSCSGATRPSTRPPASGPATRTCSCRS